MDKDRKILWVNPEIYDRLVLLKVHPKQPNWEMLKILIEREEERRKENGKEIRN